NKRLMACDLLSRRAMHPVVFGFKRGHWASVRKGLELLRPWEALKLTPSKFEYLFVLAYSALDPERPGVCREPEAMSQKMLRRILDLCDQTVSEMLKELEELQYIVRGPRGRRRHEQGHPPDLILEDGRSRAVKITPLGLELVLAVLKHRLPQRID